MEVAHTYGKLKMNWVHNGIEYYYMAVLLIFSE